MGKKNGGTITDWQVHNLDFTEEQINIVYPGQKATPKIISGTVVHDPCGRWQPGFHMRTSFVVKLDREKGIVETMNTIYKLVGKEGADVLPDLGNKILDIFY